MDDYAGVCSPVSHTNDANILSSNTFFFFFFILFFFFFSRALSSIFVLAIAKRSPAFEHLVLDFDDLVGIVIETIQFRVAFDSTAEVIVGILKTIGRKQRILSYLPH